MDQVVDLAIFENYKHDSEHDDVYWIRRALRILNDVNDPTVTNPTHADINSAILFLNYARTAKLAGPVPLPHLLQCEFEYSPFDHPYRS